MTTATVPAHGTQGVGEPVAQPGRPRPRGSFATAIRDALRRPAILIALGWLVLVVVSSVFAGALAPHDPLAQDLDARLAGPSATYWLGTDELGRDLLSRILHGGGVLLLAALIPVVVAYLLGVPIGMFVGYVGGRADALADFVVNVLFAIPALVVVLAVSVVTDNNLPFMTVVFGVIVSGGIFRLVRASTQASRDLLYVDAARVSGVSRWTILLRHILPNVLGPLIVQGFLLYSGAFLFLTSLSFLGLGFDPQQPSWGQLVFDASANLDDDPWMMVPIGAVLIATVAALNYLGNSLLATLPTAKRARLLTPPRRPVLPAEAAAGTAPAGRRTPAAAEPADSDVPLVVEDLVVSFRTPEGGWQPVVDGVSFAVHRGETLCLVGESGCGKTMTALATLGLLPEGGAAAGSVRLAGRELLDLSEREMAQVRGSQIALISQEPMGALDPCFSVRSQLGDVVKLHRGGSRAEVRRRVHELLRLVGIPNVESVAKSFPHQLSGGMAQRVCIALALAGEPSVLVADEPTTALDPTIQAEILDLLRSLQETLGLALVLVTHDLGVVADIGDVAAVMYAGQVVELAPVDELLAAPRHPYSQGLLDAMPEDAVRGVPLPTVAGMVPLPRDWPTHCRFAARCPLAVDACREGPVPLLTVQADRSSRCIRTDELARSQDLATTGVTP
ncbi:ABC transporter ATP-binding protein, putative oligo/dipeptide transport protein (modular protein) [Modestobacter italicus]|uniref:ABC transporter ATP-binding protein, putative oligo/dipeptide transport protein (Modular protein) n=1 Tax=Modestobacter italicus (strain DSM 44449 / CECT 9708 / BC 501) TaxID=2732864 RepID=I4EXR0_MODI5|nr:dipeptide/oligopeptide/nickel ABC transporter permease/ATP-binding protein [Modestobacter marinus]CCH88173.1 ABC transporter ATP-binding protein, putative oligo/dipeptide transport protein (modular protein) [Modestobacter marinus]